MNRIAFKQIGIALVMQISKSCIHHICIISNKLPFAIEQRKFWMHIKKHHCSFYICLFNPIICIYRQYEFSICMLYSKISWVCKSMILVAIQLKSIVTVAKFSYDFDWIVNWAIINYNAFKIFKCLVFYWLKTLHNIILLIVVWNYYWNFHV